MLAQENINPENKLIINPEGRNTKAKFTSSIRRANSFLSLLNQVKGPELSPKDSSAGNLIEYISCYTKHY